MRLDVMENGELGQGTRFFTSDSCAPGLPDGPKITADGTLYCTGPGGILVFSAGGELLETIPLPDVPANLAFGPGGELFVTARTNLCVVTPV